MRTMKLRYLVPAAVAVLAMAALEARAVDVQVGQGEHMTPPANNGVSVNAPGVGVKVDGAPGAPSSLGPNERVATPNVGVNVRTPAPPAIGDNRADQWRYKMENNRWWYWTPDNRWMWYSDQNGWTYYQPSGSYTTGHGGVPVTVDPVPATTYYYPNTYYPNGYYYGYPGYYGRPGVYIGLGGWGGWRGGRGRW